MRQTPEATRSADAASPIEKHSPTWPSAQPGGYGEEGTNKTVPQPKPDGAPSEELGNAPGKHVENTPYTRG